MSRMRRIVPLLQGLTLLALVAAAALLAWRPRIDATAVPPALPTVVAQAPATLPDGAALADSVVNANMFSLTREAPDERTYAAAPVDPLSENTTAGEYGADAGIGDSTSSTNANADPVPSLTGVVNGPMGRAALLRLDPAVNGSRLYRLGDGAGGYRVRSIGADRVELTGPQGPVVLELTAKSSTP